MTATFSRSRNSRRQRARGSYARPGRRLLDRAVLPPIRTAETAAPVAVIDTGLCNLDSMLRALEFCGGRPSVVREPSEVAGAERLILPGVGAFATAMIRLGNLDLIVPIRDAAARETPILGVCLGMQLLADTGTEGGETEGLGLIPGRVAPLRPAGTGERLPHIGWNAVEHDGNHPLLAGIVSGTDFYFVHGHRFDPADEADVVARTPYGGGFASVVGRGAVAGVQFHPEKSQKPGFALLRRFMAGTVLRRQVVPTVHDQLGLAVQESAPVTC